MERNRVGLPALMALGGMVCCLGAAVGLTNPALAATGDGGAGAASSTATQSRPRLLAGGTGGKVVRAPAPSTPAATTPTSLTPAGMAPAMARGHRPDGHRADGHRADGHRTDAQGPEVAAAPRPVVVSAPLQSVDGPSGSLQGAGAFGADPGGTRIEVGRQQYNRIVTPFAKAAVRTKSAEAIEVHGGVIYVAPMKDEAIHMFIVEEGDEASSIAVTLVPTNRAPVQVDLAAASLAATPATTPPATPVTALPAALPAAPVVAPQASEPTAGSALSPPIEPPRPAAQGSPLAEGDPLADVLRALAEGGVPAGFQMAAEIPTVMFAHRLCPTTPGFLTSFEGGQYMAGPSHEVFVGTARNVLQTLREFDETWCRGDRVVAVGLMPAATLDPGDVAELFVVRRLAEPPAQPPTKGGRRSLLVSQQGG